jgi:hypothetical protein
VLKSNDKRPIAPVDIDPIGGIEVIKSTDETSVQETVTDVDRPHPINTSARLFGNKATARKPNLRIRT